MNDSVNETFTVNSTLTYIRNSTWLNPDFRVQSPIWLTLILTITVFGSCCNLSLLIVILSRASSRSGSNLLIANLIFTSLLMQAAYFPMNIGVTYNQAGYGRRIPISGCSFYSGFGSTVFTCCNWTDACLGINRFVAICFPSRYRVWRRPAVVLTMILFTWLASYSVVISLYASPNGGKFTHGWMEPCTFKASNQGVGQFLINLLVFVPYSIVGLVALIVLVKTVAQRFRAVRPLEPRGIQQKQRMQRRINVARMLLISFLWSCLCLGVPLVLGTHAVWLFVDRPMLGVWLKTTFVLQYAVTPVSE